MAMKGGKIPQPITLNVKIIEQKEGAIAAGQELKANFNSNNVTPGILLPNDSAFFMDNLTYVEKIIPKPQPAVLGNVSFNTNTVITCLLDNHQKPNLFHPTVMEYIINGRVQNGTASISDGTEAMSNQPVSNRNYDTAQCRADIGGFEMPGITPRGTRKIPTVTPDTICCKSGYTYDRINYNWLFGNNAGISFDPIKSGATPIAITGSVISQEGCATISNDNGDLLFYTDGVTVYTSGNTIMTGGEGLSSSGTSTQSSLIVPQPGHNRYFIFTTDFAENPNGFEYSVVDFTNPLFPNGIVNPIDITLIPGAVSEKVTACNHSNCDDFWVITHTSGDSTFYTYKISSSGISPGPTTSIGSIHNTARGYMKTSIDGSRLVSLLYDEDIIDIFDFDASAATISNSITITGFTFDVGPYGLEFSSDSSKIYVSDGAGEKINQFDITYTSATEIKNSAIEIASISGASLGALQMGADEKIYVADMESPYLHVIHYPNGLGVNCNFQENNFPLTGVSSGNTSTWGLPNCITTKVYSCDRYKYVSSPTRGPFELDFVFNDVTKVIQSKQLDCSIKMYAFDKNENQFVSPPIGEFNVSYMDLSSTTTTTISIPSETMGQREILFKFYFSYPATTYISNQLDIISNTYPAAERGTEYLLYDERTDWYCFNMYKAQKPLFTNTLTGGVGGATSLEVTTDITNGISSIFGFNSIWSPIVALNGVVQTPILDYTITTSAITPYITFTFVPVVDQRVTIAYLTTNTTEQPIFGDTFLVTSPILSGPTNGQGDARVYMNTETGYMEIYQELTSLGRILLTIDGVIQSYGMDYMPSSSNSLRTILTSPLVVGERVTMYYIPVTGVVGVLNDNSPLITWKIPTAPLEGFGGNFVIEVAADGDIDYNNILFTTTVPHVVGEKSYITGLDLSFAEAGDKLRYRIKNNKWYVTIGGLTIRDYIYGESPIITIASNTAMQY